MTDNRSQESSGTFSANQTMSVAMPSMDSERRFPVRWTDWNKIERKIKNIPSCYNWGQLLGSLSLGTGVSGIISWLQVKDIKEFPTITYAIFIVGGIAFIILGCLCVYLDRQFNLIKVVTTNEIIEEMKEIEKPFLDAKPQGESIVSK